jgi:ABC-type nitrate/sulfonate/bicarbonate transport system substrate-binding protein
MADDTQGAIDACTKAIKQIEAYPTTYRFGDWTHCACGHLYRAVEGHYAALTIDVVEAPPEAYAAVLRTVARALGWRNSDAANAAMYVSDRSEPVRGLAVDAGRAKAVETLTTALAVLRQRLADEQKAAEYEAALAQTPHDHALAV